MLIEEKVDEMYERLVEVIDAPAGLGLRGVRGRYKRLQELTGVEAKRWQNALTGVSKPTIQMLVSICSLMPEFSAWILSGSEGDQFKIVNGMRYSKSWGDHGIVEEDLMPGGIYAQGFTANSYQEAEEEERRIARRDGHPEREI